MPEEANTSKPEPSRSVYSARSSRSNSYVAGVRLRHYPSWLAYLTALVTLTSGVYSAMAFKWMNRQQAPKCGGCVEEDFEGALLQTQLMFIGEALCLVIFLVDSWICKPKGLSNLFDFVTNPREYGHETTCKWWFWACCALLDMAASLFINIATLVTYTSTIAMLRNFMVLCAAITQLIVVRKALRVHEWFGAALITVAMVLSAVPSLSNPESSKYSTNQVTLGICLCLLATVVQSVQLLAEEVGFRKGRYPPLKAVGVEGISGLIYTFIVWLPYQKAGAENVTGSWYQQLHSGFLLTVALFYILGAILFNAAGLATTKLAGGLLRGIIFACRSPLVWIVSVIVKWQNYENWNLASSIVFVIGFLIYINCTYILNDALWMRKPIHFCCTDPALDDELQPGLKREGGEETPDLEPN